ncbi:MAG: glycogen/starch synthase, partial [Bacteroidota bacterium]
MKVLHISAECYPAAKAGGLGDVVGALPKYLSKVDMHTGVILPKYDLKWIRQQSFETVFRGVVRIHDRYYPFAIEREQSDVLGFPFYVANIPGKFDRPGIYADPGGYGYGDEVERYLSFQQAVLLWVVQMENKPEVLHCHDHHTGLVPFMVKHCFEFNSLSNIPTVFTIHNGAYHGAFGWNDRHLLPFFDANASGLLDWNNSINPLAAAIKCCWKLTTVSQSYLMELQGDSNGLEWLLRNEAPKSIGILNGIDVQVWDPKTDPYLSKPLKRSLPQFKTANKKVLCERFNIDPDLPLISFIGRLVGEKGADLIPSAIAQFFRDGHRASFIILGTGEPRLHHRFGQMTQEYPGLFDAALEYNEGLAHQIYAGSDFLMMPSRVEPCGLNQMYAMRYGTIPIVRSIGGLIDTIIDIGNKEQGRGIRFDYFSVMDAAWALYRAKELYEDQAYFKAIRKRIVQLDFSWERSAGEYVDIYEELMP